MGKPDVPNGVANREPAIFDAYIGAKQRRKDTGRLLWKWRRYRRRKSPTAVSGANMRQNCRLCKLRHRGYKSCTFYAPTTRINAGFSSGLLQAAHFVHVPQPFSLPCRTLQKAHSMGNCVIASPSSADSATGRKKGIRGSDALTCARHSRGT